MTQIYTALIRQSEGWWIGWILEIRCLLYALFLDGILLVKSEKLRRNR